MKALHLVVTRRLLDDEDVQRHAAQLSSTTMTFLGRVRGVRHFAQLWCRVGALLHVGDYASAEEAGWTATT